MLCPRCTQPMQAEEATWRCGDGHGRSLPAHASGPAAAKRVGQALPTFPTVACPARGQPMHLRHLRRIDIDVCDCGVWLDQGEEKSLRPRHPEAAWTVAEPVVWIAGGLGGLG